MKNNRIVIASVIVFISIFVFAPASESRSDHFSIRTYDNSFSAGFFPDYGGFSKLNGYDDTNKEFNDYNDVYSKRDDQHVHNLIQYFISKNTCPLLTIVYSNLSSRSPPF